MFERGSTKNRLGGNKSKRQGRREKPERASGYILTFFSSIICCNLCSHLGALAGINSRRQD